MLLAFFVSGMGTWITYVALPLVVYERTGSPLLTAVSLLVKLAPTLVLAPIEGVVVDRFNRWTIMVTSGVIRGLLLLVMAMSADNITVLIVAASLVGAVSKFSSSAALASIPNLESEDRLVRVNSISEALDSIAMIVGPVLGGIVVGLYGPRVAFVTNAMSYFVSASVICTVRIPRSAQSHGATRSVWREAVYGLQWLRVNPSLSRMVFLLSTVALAATALNALEPVYATQLSPGNAELALGKMVSAWGVGVLFGSAYVIALGNRARLRTTFLLGVTLESLSVGGVAIWAVLPRVLGFLVIGGVGNSLIDISLVSILQKSVPDQVRGRVFAFSLMLILSSQVSGMLVWGWLAQYLPVRVLFVVAGGIAMGVMVLGWLCWTLADTPGQLAGERK
ncbi:MAG TPA: hypothetical protein DEQ28_03295 [Clostridiales bacterium]|nr:hypothetical protein [Clostridiales bacterium]